MGCVYGLCSGEYMGCDGCRGYLIILWVVLCFGGGDFIDGWGRIGWFVDRKFGVLGSWRGNKWSDFCFKYNYGRGYYEFLYLL